jgi:hypothetical protein
MRKTFLAGLIGGTSFVLLAGGLANAAEPNVSPSATRVIEGTPVDFTVRNCQAGSDYSASINVRVTKTGAYPKEDYLPADADGETVLSAGSLFGGALGPGTYTFEFSCIHSGKGTWWGPETISIEVYSNAETYPTLTAGERRRCKRQGASRSGKWIRECFKREAAD